jgi:hypothetical protein
VLEETGISAPSYRTLLRRRLPIYAKDSWRQKLAAACGGHAGLGPASLVALRRVHAVFRVRCRGWVPRAGFSKERRLDPQITIGLLTRPDGIPADGQRV